MSLFRRKYIEEPIEDFDVFDEYDEFDDDYDVPRRGPLRKIGKLAKVAGGIYGILFLVFYLDLDGKLLYYIWEPAADRHYSNLEGRRDRVMNPYEMKENVSDDF